MSKRVNKELAATIKLYKIAGIVIGLLLIAGILYAIFTSERAPEPEPPQEPAKLPTEAPAKPTPDATAIPEKVAQPTATTAPKVTPTTAAVKQTPTPTVKEGVAPVSWDKIKIEFPDSLKRIGVAKTTYHYLNITEGDGTPVTNGEQFDIQVHLRDNFGRRSETVPNFEYGQWLIKLVLTNEGMYTIDVTITCKDQKGYCRRLYGEEGMAHATTTVEVV